MGVTKIPWSECPLSIGDLAEHCPACTTAHEEASRNAEYGINWYEWLAAQDVAIASMLADWWNDLTPETQLQFVQRKLDATAELLASLTAVRRTMLTTSPPDNKT